MNDRNNQNTTAKYSAGMKCMLLSEIDVLKKKA
jgi:hypothetical protein